MDKYDKLPSRTELNKELYNSYENQTYDRFDINSNQEVLKEDIRRVNVDQIREILDKKYRNDAPKRKSIDIVEPEEIVIEKEDTKEYDLKEILDKAKQSNSYDYDKNKYNKAYDISSIVEDINKKYPQDNRDYIKNSEDDELMELIKTCTRLELENSNRDAQFLGLADEEDKEEVKPDTIIESEEEFYTGNLKVTNKDFEDFSDIENDIKSNGIFIKILIFIFILVVIAIGVVVINHLFELGLF